MPMMLVSFGNGDNLDLHNQLILCCAQAPCSGPSIAGNASSPCKGGDLSKTPSSIMDKMQEFWKLAQTTPQIVGINPWHWLDRPTLQPPSFGRGAKSMGPELLALMQEVGRGVRNRTRGD